MNEFQRAIRYDAIAIAICILYLLYVAVAKIRKKTYFDKKLVPLALFILIFGIVSFQDHQSTFRYFKNEYTKLSTIYENQEYKIAEGIVHVKHMEPAEGHAAGEIIQVNDAEIEFRCASMTLGYNETIAFGGILTEGTVTRIYYYQSGTEYPEQNLILRIDLPNNKSSVNENNKVLHCTQ